MHPLAVLVKYHPQTSRLSEEIISRVVGRKQRETVGDLSAVADFHLIGPWVNKIRFTVLSRALYNFLRLFRLVYLVLTLQ